MQVRYVKCSWGSWKLATVDAKRCQLSSVANLSYVRLAAVRRAVSVSDSWSLLVDLPGYRYQILPRVAALFCEKWHLCCSKRWTTLSIFFAAAYADAITAYTRWSDWRQSSLWSHYDVHAVGQHGVLRKVKYGEDLSRYSHKTESVGLMRRPCYYLIRPTKKVMPQLQTFIRACPIAWRENSWHRYRSSMKKWRHGHPVYCQLCSGTWYRRVGCAIM